MALTSKSDTIHTDIQKMDQNWCKHRNMFGQQPRSFAVTQVHHKWKYRKKFFFGGGLLFDSHCKYTQETLKIPGNIVLFSLHTYVLQQYSVLVLDVKSKSLDVAVVCGPVLAGLQMLLLTNFVASCSRVHSIVAITLTKLYGVYVVFTLLHERRHHEI